MIMILLCNYWLLMIVINESVLMMCDEWIIIMKEWINYCND